MAVREAEPAGSLKEVKDAGLDREDLLGIYRTKLTFRHNGRDERLTDVAGEVIRKALA